MMHLHPGNSPRLALRLVPALLCGIMAWTNPVSAATRPTEFTTRYAACTPCLPQDLAWADGEFDQVHLVMEPATVRRVQPRTLSAEALKKALASLQYVAGQKIKPLLDESAAENLARGIATAMAKASPEQDAIFMITSREGSGIFAPMFGNSGRVFMDERGLNLIMGEAHVDFLGSYRATRMVRPFEFGSRNRSSRVALSANDLLQARTDWVVIPLPADDGGNPVQHSANTQPPSSEKSTVNDVRSTPVPLAHDQPYYVAQEERMKSLKRLRDQDLINEEEYQAKRKEILGAW
ncbi:MAG: SHOCT domain-containing protein [Glaciimonas sp.]|nr:SHOCT domain-containing protein [Glaciimonas sp.]